LSELMNQPAPLPSRQFVNHINQHSGHLPPIEVAFPELA